jgi:menaquinone-dependent protoporphyrinogen oxidase
MPQVLILYGTTDGHTGKVADALEKSLVGLGAMVDVVEARERKANEVRVEDYDAVLVAASIHVGRFQRSVERWVRRNAEGLNRKPSAFLAVCLAILDEVPEADEHVERIKSRFFERCGWRPRSTLTVAGAIPYTRYGFFKKWLMKRISAARAGDTDTTRDFEYTDWAELDRFAREIARVSGLKLTEALSETA